MGFRLTQKKWRAGEHSPPSSSFRMKPAQYPIQHSPPPPSGPANRPRKEQRVDPSQSNAYPCSRTRSRTDGGPPSGTRGVFHPTCNRFVEIGIPVRSAVLQHVGKEGLGNPQRPRSNYGGHPQFLERGVVGDFEMGTSVRRSSLFHSFVDLTLSTR